MTQPKQCTYILEPNPDTYISEFVACICWVFPKRIPFRDLTSNWSCNHHITPEWALTRSLGKFTYKRGLAWRHIPYSVNGFMLPSRVLWSLGLETIARHGNLGWHLFECFSMDTQKQIYLQRFLIFRIILKQTLKL